MRRKTRTYRWVFLLTNLLILFSTQLWLHRDWNALLVMKVSLLNLLIFAGIYAFRGLDFRPTRNINETVVSYALGSLAGMLIALIPMLSLPGPRLGTIPMVVTFFFSALVSPFLFHGLIRTIIRFIPPERLLIIGKQEELEPMMKEVQAQSLGKVQVYAYINPSEPLLEQTLEQSQAFDSIIIGDPHLTAGIETLLRKARQNQISVDFLPKIVESHLKRIPLELIAKFEEYYEISFSHPNNSPAKRIMDLFLALFLIIVTSPIMILLYILIPLDSGFPILFRHTRMGFKNQPFSFLKFRSLTTIEAEELEQEQNPNQTIHQRLTKIGRVIRKLRFDEFPQFFNVLANTMSMIGPRPEMIQYHTLCEQNIPYYQYRNNLKPGITGWAQIHYKHTTTLSDYKTKTEYDLYYIKNRNIFLDLQIALQTVETMFGMRGSR